MIEVKTHKFIANIIASALSTKYSISMRNADTNKQCILCIDTDITTYTNEVAKIKDKFINYLHTLA